MEAAVIKLINAIEAIMADEARRIRAYGPQAVAMSTDVREEARRAVLEALAKQEPR